MTYQAECEQNADEFENFPQAAKLQKESGVTHVEFSNGQLALGFDSVGCVGKFTIDSLIEAKYD